MARRMLIDTTHSEETRVVVLNGNRLEEFDFETSTKKQIKGNIYLAKITRVEPSLQAAFVEYGGNRHGFLAFSEIHPDYYRIPVSDREAMLAEERAAHDVDDNGDNGHHHEPDNQPDFDHPSAMYDADETSDSAESFQPAEPTGAGRDAPEDVENRGEGQATDEGLAASTQYEAVESEASFVEEAAVTFHGDAVATETIAAEGEPAESDGSQGEATAGDSAANDAGVTSVVEVHDELTQPETVGGDEFEEVQARPRVRHYRNYKIQEVIKRRQILLIQVTKEERGNKGAALTTYLSLAGRYCVLMPNAGRGGGVSRKITSAADRRRLKELMEELEVPEGMGIIVRTAGSERSKAEIKRDYEYLLRLWDEIRELTLRSSAPALIYEEGNLIKRAIRDLYSRDMEEILVEGDNGYRTAKEFMRMLMPSHAARVKAYRDPTIPLLHRFQVDSQIDQIHNPVVQLRSGGYIVINPTEALVSIDVNSGRATRERNIEETATKTNLEAAEEIARQLRLRDLAGLVVIDFIDMEETRNQKAVEARLKDAMKTDRARIQLGRISAFGLLELSRQRLRSSLIEASTLPCPHCNGTGTIRSTESTALVVLRALEEEGIRRRSAEVAIYVPTPIALYVLNQKRETLTQIEQRYGFRVTVGQDDSLIPPAFRLDRVRALTPQELSALPVPILAPMPEEEEEEEYIEEEAVAEAAVPGTAAEPHAEGDGSRRKRRRRKRRRGGEELAAQAPHGGEEEGEAQEGAELEDEEQQGEEQPGEEQPGEAASEHTDAAAFDANAERKRRRRGKRGGRRRRREDEAPHEAAAAAPADEDAPYVEEEYPSVFDYARDGREHLFEEHEAPAGAVTAPAPSVEPAASAPVEATAETGEAIDEPADGAKPKRRRAPRKKAAETEAIPVEAPTVAATEAEPAAKRRRPRKTAKVEAVAEPVAAVGLTPEEAPAAESAQIVEQAPAEAAADLAPTAETADLPVEAAPAAEPEPALDPNRPRKTGWWKRLMQ